MSLTPLGGSNGAIMLGTTSQLNTDGTTTQGLGYANAGTINVLADASGFGGVNTLGEILYVSTVGGLKIANIQPGTTSAIDPATGKPPTGIFPNGTLLNGIAGEWNSQHQIVNATQFWEKGTVYQTSDLIGTNSGWSGFYPSGMMGKVINDAGCIVGTATYTPNGTNDPTAAGSHGVLLAPITIQRRVADQTNYTAISTAQPYPQNVVVAGQLMDLKLVQSGTSFPITNIQWMIDGTTFKNYVANNSTGTLTQLAATDLNKTDQTVQFFWADTGQKKVVCKFDVGQSHAQTSFTFTVVAPTNAALTRPVTRGTVAVDPPGYFPNDSAFYLTSSQTGTKGIQYTYTWTPIASSNDPYGVEMQVVQLWTPGRTYQDSSQKIWKYTLNGQLIPVLDGGAFPYPSLHSSSTSVTGTDTPSAGLQISDTYFKVNDTFDVWLLCRSLQGKPGTPVDTSTESSITSTVSSTWAPISHFTWTWSGEAAPSGTNMVLKPGSGSSPQPTAEQSSSIQPQWTANSATLQFTQ